MNRDTHDPAYFLYDGDCGFCDHTVRFLLDRSDAGRLMFSPIQSEFGTALLARHEIDSARLTSSYLVAGNTIHIDSAAVLEALRRCRSGWRHLGALRAVPRGLRDPVYRFLAARRDTISRFVRRSCEIPTPEERRRFVHDTKAASAG